jgi:hypothetical protein
MPPVIQAKEWFVGIFHLERSMLGYAQARNDEFMVFFGIYCVLIGYLIFRSTFLPRIVGALMACAGLGYLTLLYAPHADYLHPYNLAPGALGEPSLMLWLPIVGVNVERWKERASSIGEWRA